MLILRAPRLKLQKSKILSNNKRCLSLHSGFREYPWGYAQQDGAVGVFEPNRKNKKLLIRAEFLLGCSSLSARRLVQTNRLLRQTRTAHDSRHSRLSLMRGTASSYRVCAPQLDLFSRSVAVNLCVRDEIGPRQAQWILDGLANSLRLAQVGSSGHHSRVRSPTSV
ncbi:hypothetical protein DFJ73DRAFT_520068 [Zopfochytrium polystomum]|nr:hypothetical protein DFJ73DRAFT_520068 [Zopfochytrium polystomum]